MSTHHDFASILEGDEFDTLSFSKNLYERQPLKLSFKATNLNEAIEWQRKLRSQLLKLLGGFPRRKCELAPRVLERVNLSFRTPSGELVEYNRETIIFKSREGLSVYAYHLAPKGADMRLPCVVCLPGHGRGVDDIVGINPDGSLRETYGGYQMDFALQCLEHGYAALAVEQLGFGHRRDERSRKQSPETSSCQPAAGAALLFGETMLGWRVYDAIRSIDYLHTREDVDVNRIAIMGISGGGATALFTAAIDERIKVAVVSGYFNTFRDSIMSISHCIDNYIPGILRFAEMWDIAGLVAPRALFIESGTKDPIFPIDATLRSYEKLKRIYDVFNANEKLGIEVFEGEHQFYGKGAFEFLHRWL
ncbi:MAG: alpha/beta hydrolase family protein [Armatimonadota bacterium]|nr:alpha/beta hydrolase family protein [Armatimonadota bacterium]MCX7776844.1 alpha/beta hydrolase family protein [Armatimonadota bacterium]MDW8024470.1 alpha/beta hydrolase family protein [Armatimonadota bacterium]